MNWKEIGILVENNSNDSELGKRIRIEYWKYKHILTILETQRNID